MKKRIKFIAIFLLTSLFISCGEDVETPDFNFTVDNLSPKVGEKIKFTINGDAETFVIFTGNPGHEFEKSHMALTIGLDLDQELVVLNSSRLQDIRNFLLPRVNNYNSTVGPNAQLDIDAIMTNIATQVDIEYTNKLTAAYIIWQYMTELSGQVARDIVNNFYEDKSTLLAPTGGFSTGFAVNRYDKTMEYTYNIPGMYIVTLIATNVSDKNYSGSGYQDDRTSFAGEYNYGRSIRELIITVQQ